MAEQLSATDTTEAFIRQLAGGRNWVERRDGAAALAMMAREAVLALRKAAQDKDPDVAHECRKSVETIAGDLTATLPELEMEIAAALRAYHADRGARSPAAAPGGAAAAGAPGGGEPTAEAIGAWLGEIVVKHGGQASQTEGKWLLELGVGRGRTQKLFVEADKTDSNGRGVIVVYTICGPAEAKVLRAALKSNMQLSHAAFGLMAQGEGHLLALQSRRRRAGLTREGLEEDLLYVARKGDQAEAQLQGADVH